MARPFAVDIDMLGNQLLNAKFQILASDPGSPAEGQFWYNSTDKLLKYRTNAATVTLGQIDLSPYAPKESPAFTGNPTAPTPTAGDNDTTIATTAFVKAAIDALVNGAGTTLDTLNELAAALGNDANFATTVTNALATKATKYTTTIGGATSSVVTHNLNTRNVVVSVHDATTFEEIVADVTKTSANTVTIGFATAPAANSRVVTVLG